MTRPGRAVVYVRLSSYRGDDDPTLSHEAQEERCRAYCAAKGWEVVKVVSDLDVSGSDKGLRMNRPGLLEVRSLLPEADVVIFAKLDRLARNVSDFRAFAEEAESHSVSLVSVAESLDLTTSTGRFVSTILAAFAEMEAATIAERVKGAKQALAKAQRWTASVTPYGYVSVPHPFGRGRGLALVPAEVAIIEEAARRVCNGEPVTAIARDFNTRGVPRAGVTPDTGKPSRRGGKWTASTITRILRNPATTGHLIYNETPVLDEETGLPARPWEPALSPSLQRAALAALDGWSEPRPGWSGTAPIRHRETRLLTGAVVCAGCSRPMRTATLKGEEHYRCNARSESVPCPSPTTVLASKLEAYIESEFLKALGPVRVTLLEESADEDARERVKSATAALTVLGQAIADEDDDDALEELMRRRKVLRATLQEAREAAEVVHVRRVESDRTIADVWDDEDLNGKRALLLRRLDHVAVRAIGRGHHRRPVADRVEPFWYPDDEEDYDAA